MVFGLLGVAGQLVGWHGLATGLYGLAVVSGSFMVYFFRDPERVPPADPQIIVAGADGLVRAVGTMREDRFLHADSVRISVFLSPLNVHVNRAPLAGRITALAYTPGQHLLTLRNAASERNEHSSILIEGEGTRCLVKQIVGPIVRRVVYWLELHQTVGRGERIGMMKFGSRLDMYFPRSDVEILVRKGDIVKAGLTPVARLNKSK